MRSMKLYAVVIGLFVAAALPIPAPAQTYGTWEDPDATQSQDAASSDDAAARRLQSFVKRLRAIVDQAEKDKAADPLLLRDLRALADGYDRPWTVLSLDDGFADGDYTNNPAWTVGQGGYFIEKGWGLRNKLERARSSSGDSGEEVAAQIFGQILNQALGGSGAQTTSSYQPTSIYIDTAIANAFAAEIEISSWVGEGRLSFGPYQGADRIAGYRVAYTVGGAIDLLAVSSRGSRTIQRAPGPYSLEDKEIHTIAVERKTDGLTRVLLDGEAIIEVRDRSFRDDFAGWGFATDGGDFIVKRVTVHSVP